MRKLIIVGGGSAGWITASYLNGALNEQGKRPRVDITVIESPDIPRITVGEAPIPNILKTLNVIGVDEIEFMRATEATFKQSIRFVDWVKKDGSSYHHPFNIIRSEPYDSYGYDWLCSDRSAPFIDMVSDQPRICEMNLAPKQLQQWNFGPPFQYAFHMNALKFADYLRDYSVARGVKHVPANVTDIHMRENGLIDRVSIDAGDDIKGDMFVDCTGFKSLLLAQQYDVPCDDYSQWLLCNRAVVAQFSYEDYYPGCVRPYTTATALSSGWAWDIPMQTRRSVGYVHSSAFINEDDAVSELLAYQGVEPGMVDTRTIPFFVGQRRKAWVGNCVAVGLAGGFIEPLESTGLYLCDEAATVLAEYFPFSDEDLEPFSQRFNRIISNRYFEILDFINMHYCLTKRDDTEFWRTVQQPKHINDRLKAKLEFWTRKEPSAQDFIDQSFMGTNPMISMGDGSFVRTPVDSGRLWNYESYKSVLYGMHYDGYDPSDLDYSKRPKPSPIPFVAERVKHARQYLPPHDVWLKRALGMQEWETAARPLGWCND
jgi:tryptophan halogenase